MTRVLLAAAFCAATGNHMSPLPDACAAITTWLPQAAALTHQPDTDGSSGHGKPGSRPP